MLPPTTPATENTRIRNEHDLFMQQLRMRALVPDRPTRRFAALRRLFAVRRTEAQPAAKRQTLTMAPVNEQN